MKDDVQYCDPRLISLCLNCRMAQCRGICDTYRRMYAEIYNAMSRPRSRVVPYEKPVTYKGKTKTLREWAKEIGISYQALYNRLADYNRTPEQAIALGPSYIIPEYTLNGETHRLSVWAKRYNISSNTVNARMRKGWSFEKAISTPTIGTGRHAKERRNDCGLHDAGPEAAD